MKHLIILLIILLFGIVSNADCVYGAKDKTKFKIIDEKTILLTGGYGKDILIKIYDYYTIQSYARVTVLKDSFCSYDSKVLLIDKRVTDVAEVTGL